MLNATIPATAGGMPKSEDAITRHLGDFLRHLHNLKSHQIARNAAKDALPEWAAGGPEFLNSDGELVGAHVGWPMRQPLPEPPSYQGAFRLVRPSPRAVFKNHTCMTPQLDWIKQAEPDRAERLAAARRADRLRGFKAAVREVLARIRAQREEERKVGIPALDAAMDADIAGMDAAEESLRAFVTGSSVDEMAALIFMQLYYETRPATPIDELNESEHFLVQLIKLLAPQMSGLVRIVAEDLIRSDGARRIDETLLGGGIAAPAEDVVAQGAVEGMAA